MGRHILHIDMNCFYASVEMQRHPEYRNVPLAVCGSQEDRHGIVLTANYLAKPRGVKVGQAIWQAKQVCPELVTLPPDMSEYIRFSHMAREIYEDYTDQIEPFGLDENWLDVTGSVGCKGSPMAIAREISERIKFELGITASIGVADNKITAKLGSDYKKPDGTTVFSRENFKQRVWTLPANTLLYVGKRASDRLNRLGVRTIGELAACDPAFIHSILGKNGDLLLRYARGEDDEPVRSFYAEREVKSVGNSMTFAHNLLGADECRMGITALCDNVGRRLRKRGMVCQTVQLGIRDPEFHNRSRQITLERPTNSTRALIDLSMQLLLGHWPMDKPVRLLSVTAANLLPENQSCEQLSLFDAAEDIQKRDRQHKLDQTVDALRQKFGDQSVVFAHSVKKKDKTDKK